MVSSGVCQNSTLPCASLCRGQALAAVADGAAESRRNVRPKSVVITEGLGRVLHGRVFHAEVAGGAAVHALQAGEQHLVDLRAACQHRGLGHRVGLALRFQLVELPLVGFPRRACWPARWRPASGASAKQGSAKKKNCGSLRSIYSPPATTWTHGGTNAQPGTAEESPDHDQHHVDDDKA